MRLFVQTLLLPTVTLFAINAHGQTAPNPTAIPSDNSVQSIETLCTKIDENFRKFGWQQSDCSKVPWRFSLSSEKEAPLLYAQFGRKEAAVDSETETTLILGGIHGDETPSVFVLFRQASELLAQETALVQNNKRVIIAPLINPDGFFVRRRTNANGIDLNRNFPTKDWTSGALKLWKVRRKSSPIHFPGHAPGTEAGTKFQMELIDHFSPDKIISVHCPLNFIDYDGPGDAKSPSSLSAEERRAKEIALLLGKYSRGRKVVDYPFFPGSLGNYAGNEREIPTITLELASSQPRYAGKFWDEFRIGISKVIDYKFRKLSLATRNESKP